MINLNRKVVSILKKKINNWLKLKILFLYPILQFISVYPLS